jgi:PAS domain S-box-containing protein
MSAEELRLDGDANADPGRDFGGQELAEVVDIPAIQSLLEEFSRLTNMVTAILDLKGNVLVATGWQDVCTKFHRVNPQTSRNCLESDLFLARNVKPGEHVLYKCKNNLWDVVTPLLIGDKHVGNIYSGQFFFEDEAVDVGVFEEIAARHGFDREQYLAAVGRVPRFSRERVESLMDFLAKFSTLVSRLSYGNLKLARAIRHQARTEVALRETEAWFRQLAQQAPVPIAICGLGGGIEYLNDRFTAIFGYTRDDIPGVEDWFARAYPDEQYRREAAANWRGAVDRAVRDNIDIERSEYRVSCKDGTVRATVIFGTRIGDRLLVLLDDISERKRAEQERASLEQQLQQAQKMEAIGRLAGGVAHDFNNLLTVIKGYGDLALDQIGNPETVRESLLQIRNAGQHGADLTRQLLTFSRKQVLQPCVLDLAEVVREARQMLRRVLSENIELSCGFDEPLGKVKLDRGQVHQVLMNLVMNARDAMPDGGRLEIEVRNVLLDSAGGGHEPVPAGPYVLLSVCDTGTGMEDEVKRHLFEPFFTTKERGHGTGLGLATVFGVVQQNGGYIQVHSEAGCGTVFRIYLPRVDEPGERAPDPDRGRQDLRGHETILVVEDQREVRELTRIILEGYGYRVLDAANGQEALRVCQPHDGTIHAVVTDVVMPGMNGWDLAARLTALRPEIRVLFMSGYIDNVAMRQTVFDGAVDFIQKPFTPEGLARKLRESLNRPR